MRTITLSELKTLCLQRADMQNTQFIDSSADAELTQYINSSLAELHDLLTIKYEYYHHTSRVIQLNGSQDIYTLPEDFYKVAGVDVDISSAFTQPFTVRRFNFEERNRYHTIPFVIGPNGGVIDMQYLVVGNYIRIMPIPTTFSWMRIWYYPRAKVLTDTTRTFTDSAVSVANNTITYASHNYSTADRISFTNTGGALPTPIASATDYYVIPVTANTFSIATSPQNAFSNQPLDITSAAGGGTNTIDDDLDIFDGINGWEEYIIIDTAIKMLVKEESPTVAELMAQKQNLIARIAIAAANRDAGSPKRITDIHTTNGIRGGRLY